MTLDMREKVNRAELFTRVDKSNKSMLFFEYSYRQSLKEWEPYGWFKVETQHIVLWKGRLLFTPLGYMLGVYAEWVREGV